MSDIDITFPVPDDEIEAALKLVVQFVENADREPDKDWLTDETAEAMLMLGRIGFDDDMGRPTAKGIAWMNQRFGRDPGWELPSLG